VLSSCPSQRHHEARHIIFDANTKARNKISTAPLNNAFKNYLVEEYDFKSSSNFPTGCSLFETLSQAEGRRSQLVSEAPRANKQVVEVNWNPGPLAPNTIYYWRVAGNSSGGAGAFGTAANFSTTAATVPVPVVNSKARLLMLIDRSGKWWRSNTAITNNADKLLAGFSFYVPGDWLTNQLAHMPFEAFP
jgi:hypothetical protein